MNYDEVDFNPNDIWDTDFYEAASLSKLHGRRVGWSAGLCLRTITRYSKGYQAYRYTKLPF